MFDQTSKRAACIARRFGSARLASLILLIVALAGFGSPTAAGPADAVQSAIQSHIQSVRDDVYYRTRRANAAGMTSGVSYCMRRFRSYNPYSMTYVGYDGRRRHCS